MENDVSAFFGVSLLVIFGWFCGITQGITWNTDVGQLELKTKKAYELCKEFGGPLSLDTSELFDDLFFSEVICNDGTEITGFVY